MALNSQTRAEGEMVRGRIFGMFKDRDEAIEAIRALQSAGFKQSQIGVAMKDRGDNRDLLEETGTEAAKGAASGAVGGGVLGGLVGLLSSLLIPGLGPVVAGGVLLTTLTGAGIGAAAGGIIGGLVGAGASEEEARHFDERFRAGGALVTVDAMEREADAVRILERHGADLGPTRGRQVAVDGDSAVDRPAATIGSFQHADASPTRPATGYRSYSGTERRYRDDPAYSGPERRLVAV